MLWGVLGGIAAAIVLAVIVLLLLARRAGRLYEVLFAADHLRELATSLKQAKAEALGAPVAPDRPVPRGGFVTSAALVILYTVSPDPSSAPGGGATEGRLAHTFSISHRRGWFASHAAAILAAYIARILGLKLSGFVFAVTKGRYLLVTLLDDANHAAYAGGAVEIPDNLAPLFTQARADAAQIRFKEIDAPQRVLPA